MTDVVCMCLRKIRELFVSYISVGDLVLCRGKVVFKMYGNCPVFKLIETFNISMVSFHLLDFRSILALLSVA